MKTSLSWLQTHLDLSGRTTAQLSNLLTFAGIEVEGIEEKGVDSDKIVVGQILESVQHPNADRLSVCQVDDGSGKPRQIVCGAKNYKVGDKVPVALPGAILPGNFEIKEGQLRKVASNGMMCSGKELGLGDDHSGLLILDPELPVGKLFKELVQPVSIGAGIAKTPPDSPAIALGLENAHQQDGTAIWCHNNWGFEDVPNWLAGRLDAQNIFDGGSHGGYADSFYHYLNAGLKVPFSTGTDWFMDNFARVYAEVAGELTPESWLAALRAGRTSITNGPLLELKVNNVRVGDTLDLSQSGEITVTASAIGRGNFETLEIIQNGQVVASETSKSVYGHFSATLRKPINVSEPGWLAARITTANKNEYGRTLFGHTSAVYVTLQGRSIRRAADVAWLRHEVETARATIAEKAQFDTAEQRQKVLGLYDQSLKTLAE